MHLGAHEKQLDKRQKRPGSSSAEKRSKGQGHEGPGVRQQGLAEERVGLHGECTQEAG